MFIGCSEISIYVIVKHVQQGIVRVFLSAWGDFLSLLVLGRHKKLLGCDLLVGVSSQVGTSCWLLSHAYKCLWETLDFSDFHLYFLS